MRHQTTFRFPALLSLILFLCFGGFIQDARSQGTEPVTIRLVIRDGNAVWNMCRTLAHVRQLPGTINDCVQDTAARNNISNMRAIPAGAVLTFAVVSLPGEATTDTSALERLLAEMRTQNALLSEQVRTLTEQLDEALQQGTGATDTRPYWLAIGLLAIALLAAVAAWLMERQGRANDLRAHAEDMGDLQEKYRETKDGKCALARENEELIKTMTEHMEQRDLDPVPVILNQRYVGDGNVPAHERTIYIHFTGIKTSDGETKLFCRLPWGPRRYRQRKIEQEFYDHERELEEKLGIAVQFPEHQRNLSYLFEEGPPPEEELLERYGIPPSQGEYRAMH